MDVVVLAQFDYGVSAEVGERFCFLATVVALHQLVHDVLLKDDLVFFLLLSQPFIFLVLLHLRVDPLQASLAAERK